MNIVNVVVECDIIYVSILYHLYRICKAGQFAGIYSPLVKSIYILKVQRRGGGDENFYGSWLYLVDPNRNMNEEVWIIQ